MEKEFIPYEQALVLKELGFEEKCAVCFLFNGNKLEWELKNLSSKNEYPHIISAPLYQQAFRWFREKYGLNFECKTPDGKDGVWLPEIHKIKGIGNYYDNDGFESYEEAELECLKKLIEIVKSK